MGDYIVWSDIYGNTGIDYQNLLEILKNQHKSVIIQPISTCEKLNINKDENSVLIISDEAFVRRFLILRTTRCTYYTSETELTMQTANKLRELIEKGSGLILLRELIKVSLSDRIPKQNSVFFALALCARYQMRDLTSKIVVPSKVDNEEEIHTESTEKCSSTERNAECRQFTQPMNTAYQKALQQLALYAVPKICENPSHLFMFVKYCKLIAGETGMIVKSKGWGRALRATISNWCLSQNPEQLVMQITKYRNSEGYCHRDLFRLGHVRPHSTSPIDRNYWKYQAEYDAIFKFIAEDNTNSRKRKKKSVESVAKQHKLDDEKVKGEQQEEGIEIEKEIKEMAKLTLAKKNEAALTEEMQSKEAPIAETSKVLQFLEDFKQLQELTLDDTDKAVELINKNGFVYEHIPEVLLNSKDIWKALLVRMPLTVMMKNLYKMTVVDLLGSKEHHRIYNQMVVDKLRDKKILKEANIHPISIILTYAAYFDEYGYRRVEEMEWEPSKDIVNALEIAFCLLSKYIKPTNRRYCLAFNVSDRMDFSASNDMLPCSQVAAAFALTFIRTESHVTTVTFSSCMVPFILDYEMNLYDVHKLMGLFTADTTDCALPMIWAKQNKLLIDVFIICTNNKICSDSENAFVALQDYRTTMDIPYAKLIVINMAETNFNIADPTDPDMLDIYGFDSTVPDLIREFASGTLSF